jgi:hypothetical protein
MSFKVFIGYTYMLQIINLYLRFKNGSIDLHFAYLSIFDFFLQNRNFFVEKANFMKNFKILYLRIFEDIYHLIAQD